MLGYTNMDATVKRNGFKLLQFRPRIQLGEGAGAETGAALNIEQKNKGEL